MQRNFWESWNFTLFYINFPSPRVSSLINAFVCIPTSPSWISFKCGCLLGRRLVGEGKIEILKSKFQQSFFVPFNEKELFVDTIYYGQNCGHSGHFLPNEQKQINNWVNDLDTVNLHICCNQRILKSKFMRFKDSIIYFLKELK